ncbi:MGMT family protein [Halobacillus sp. A1]|uniref:MGMT family protein n=1 Tax=Halobacillus sp. A1 TaxID=2880262 RepID=UPI0020A625E6|nr:MGMT family protein [Halobacillus sp. A1]MCP3030988.1 MGMT family protein [Halobacillus sp. A1]
MKPFTQQVIHVISSIPAGTVMTYGQVARAAGSPRAARQVVRVLHTMSRKYNLPWHRVVNGKGEIAIKDEESAFEQQSALEAEGVVVVNKKIDLQEFQYTGVKQGDHYV